MKVRANDEASTGVQRFGRFVSVILNCKNIAASEKVDNVDRSKKP